MKLLTTGEAAHFVGVHPNSFHRWATTRGIFPHVRKRHGRSWRTYWLQMDLIRHARDVLDTS